MRKKIKKITAVIMVFVMAFIMIPFCVTSVNGVSSDNLIIEDGVLIDGKKATGDIVIPDGVTKIGVNAFCNGVNRYGVAYGADIKSVRIPSSVKSIEAFAFAGCNQLEKIVFSNGLEIIDDYAFDSCNFHSVEFPDSLKYIGERAFLNCTDFCSITIPSSVESIGEHALGYTSIGYRESNGEELDHKIHIRGYGSTSAEQYANDNEFKFESLDNCVKSGNIVYKVMADNSIGIIKYLGDETTVKIPDEYDGAFVTEIAAGAFEDNKKLTEVYLPNNLISLGDGVFYNCKNLQIVHTPNKLNSIGACCFKNCINLVSLYMPDGFNKIGKAAFRLCKKIDNIVIPNSVTELPISNISCGLFDGCESLSNIKLSENIETISYATFFSCTNLKHITIPKRVKVINNYSLGYYTYDKKVEGFTIYGYSGTAAETYAKENGFTFVELEESTIGDTNGDNNVDVLDAAAVQKHASGISELNSEQLAAADVNGDGNVDVLDAAEIQKFAAGIISEFKKKV